MRLKPAVLGMVCSALLVSAPAVEPTTADVFFRLGPQGELVPLERQAPAIKGHSGGFMVASIKTDAEIPGGKSPVRFHAGEPFTFVVKPLFGAAQIDMNSVYCLRKLEAGKKKRYYVLMSGRITPLTSSLNTDRQRGTLPIQFGQFGSGSVRVSVGPLDPGEYAIGRITGNVLFCFGVD